MIVDRKQIDRLLIEAELYLVAMLREAISTPDYSGPSDPFIEATVKARKRIVGLLVEIGNGNGGMEAKP